MSIIEATIHQPQYSIAVIYPPRRVTTTNPTIVSRMGNAKITPIIPKNIFIIIHLLSIKELVILANLKCHVDQNRFPIVLV